jgi:hypothetical protein
MFFDCGCLPRPTVLTLQLQGQSTSSLVEKRQQSLQNTTQNDGTVKIRSESQGKLGSEQSATSRPLRRKPPRTSPPGARHSRK